MDTETADGVKGGALHVDTETAEVSREGLCTWIPRLQRCQGRGFARGYRDCRGVKGGALHVDTETGERCTHSDCQAETGFISLLQCCCTSTETAGITGDGSPGPPLSHSFCAVV